MLRILLELYRFSGFLAVPAICMLLVCPRSKYVFVSMSKGMLNNDNEPSLTRNELVVPGISSTYCEPRAHHLVKNLIQNP
jgi:hypothetical protein